MVNQNPQMRQMLTNPQLMRQAMQMMDDPVYQQMINNQMGNMGGLGGLGGLGGFGGNNNMGGFGQPGQNTGFGFGQQQNQSFGQQQNQSFGQQQNQSFGQQQFQQPQNTGFNNNQNNSDLFRQAFNNLNQPQQNLNQNNNNNNQNNQQQQNYEEIYKDQLSQLEAMGFVNKDLNLQVLKQCSGNVNVAVERLLNMMGWLLNI